MINVRTNGTGFAKYTAFWASVQQLGATAEAATVLFETDPDTAAEVLTTLTTGLRRLISDLAADLRGN